MGELLIRNVDEDVLAALYAAAATRGITVDAAASALLKRAVDQSMPEPQASSAAEILTRARGDKAADATDVIRRDRDGVGERVPPAEAVRLARELREQAPRRCLPDSTSGIRQDRER